MNKKNQLLVLIGTKAQFIKTAPVLRELDQRKLDYQVIYTGQHSETFELLESGFGTRSADDNLVPGVEADTNLGFVSWSWWFWCAVARRLARRQWSGAAWGLVHGDTASTLFGALALRLAGVKVAHIEAGLRSPHLLIPFPEEIIRRWVSVFSSLHFAPSAEAAANLAGRAGLVVDTHGNTLRDALILALARIEGLPETGGGGGYAVVSLHRSENLQNPKDLCFLMEEIIETARHVPIKFVLHPVTRKKIYATGWIDRLKLVPGLDLVDRMDYIDFIRLLIGAQFLMTDGGSNQEEAAMLGLPTLLLRRATERSDGVPEGIVLLSGLDRSVIRKFVADKVGAAWALQQVRGRSPSQIIVDVLLEPSASATTAARQFDA